MPIRLSGLASGLDTEAIVGALVSAYSYKKDKYVKAQTKLSWKQDAWKTLNSKVYSLYTSVGTMRYSSNYTAKKATVSDTSKATATAGGDAVNGTQTLEVKQLAKTAYVTGGKLADSVTGETSLGSLGIITSSSSQSAGITVRTGTKSTKINIDSSTTINQFVSKLKDAGLNANFDEKNHRFYISSSTSGKDGDFSISATSTNGLDALMKLGLLSNSEIASISSENAANTKYTYNGVVTTESGLEDIISNINKAYAVLADSVSTAADKEWANNYLATSEAKAVMEQIKTDFGEQDWGNLTSSQIKTLRSNIISTKATKASSAEYISKTYGGVSTTQSGFADIISNIKTYKATAADDSIADDSEAKTTANEYLEKYASLISQLETDGIIASDAWDTLSTDDITTAATTAYSKAKYDTAAADATKEEISKAVNAVRDAYVALANANSLPNSTSEEQAARSAAIATAKTDLTKTLADPTNAKWASYIEENFGTRNSTTDSGYDNFWVQSDNLELANDVFYRVDLAQQVLDGKITLDTENAAIKIDGADSEILLNGVSYSGSTNSITVNGLTIEALAVTTDAITINVSNDTDALYDKVKDFLTSYNSLMNEMQSLYNADSAKDYEPLTDDEKAEMSETEIEKWEQKIKDSLLRRDTSLSGIISSMTLAMMKTYNVNGETLSWSYFGVHTLGTLNAEKNEGYAYHIDGDSEDSYTSGNKDKLRSALAEDPDKVIEFLKQMTSGLYSDLDKKMKSTAVKSVYTVYNDKEMASEYSDYSTLIKTWTDRVTDMEDAYYKKFSAMEKALATLQSNSSSISSLLGG